jgi:antitoxin HicB
VLTYTVIVRLHADSEYSVTVPALNNCGTFGSTLVEALQMAEEAIEAYLQGLEFLGQPFPPDVPTVTVELDDALEAAVHRVPVRRKELAVA